MKKLLAFFTLGLMMMPVSCVKEQFANNENGTLVKELTFKAVMEGATVRSTLDETTGKVAWTVGDAVKFAWELDGKDGVGYAESAALTELSNDGSAEFTAEVPSVFLEKTAEEYKADGGVSIHMYAAYPATVDVNYSNASDYILTVPSEQDGSFANASIALAKWNNEKPAAPLVFQNLCGLLQIKIADANAKKLVITSSTDIAGKASITFPAAGPKVKEMKEASKTISVALNGEGTYYVAVYPGELEDVYVEVFDASDKLIGDRLANNLIPVSRSQVRKLGTIGTGFGDRFYVKERGSGDKTGSSWDNAADMAGLKTQVAKAETKKIYIAAGTYSTKVSGELSIKNGNYSIYGGYPADAEGYAVNNRNISENEVIFDGGHSSEANGARIMVLNPGNVLVEGVTFQNAYSTSTSGSAIVIAGASVTEFNKCTIKNCAFKNASDATGVAGVVRVSGSSKNTFNDCVFEGNTTNAKAGVFNQYADAKLNLNNCEFYSNTSGHYGGVIYTIGEVNINDCIFGASGKGNSSTSRGGVITMSAGSKVNVANTTFAYNSGAIGGVMYVDAITDAASLTVTNTKFVNNTATNTSNGGGAVGISGDSNTYTGMLKFEKVLFDANTTPSCGGAIWASGASVSFTDCSFTSNAVTAAAASENALGGGAVYSASSVATKIFFDRCFFANNAVNKKIDENGALATDNKTYKWGHHIDINSSTAYLGMNNCVIRAPWGVTMTDTSYKGIGSLVTTRAFTAIVNTTLYSQTGNPMITQGANNATGCSFINVIAVNAAGTPNVFYNHDSNRYLNLYYTLYTQVKSGLKNFTETSSLSGVTYGDLGWAKAGNGTSISVDDVRGHIYAYDWSGAIDGKSFTKPTLDQVKTTLTNTTNVGPSFLEWLGESNLKIDIRKESRDTQSMWPGSYQGSVSANVENFNVR